MFQQIKSKVSLMVVFRMHCMMCLCRECLILTPWSSEVLEHFSSQYTPSAQNWKLSCEASMATDTGPTAATAAISLPSSPSGMSTKPVSSAPEFCGLYLHAKGLRSALYCTSNASRFQMTIKLFKPWVKLLHFYQGSRFYALQPMSLREDTDF